MDSPENIIGRSADASPEELVRQIYGAAAWESRVDNWLRYRPYVQPDDDDETLDNLIGWYVNKKSRRVAYAGRKLKNAFPVLPRVEQRRVGLALLGGNRADTEWVCKRLNDHWAGYGRPLAVNWHPCYAEAVEACWAKYHGSWCGRLVVQYLPEEVVCRHMDELSSPDYYFYLSRRFVGRPWFRLDVDKLRRCTYINAYLHVMSHTREGIPADEARRLLYQWVATLVCRNDDDINLPIRENVFYRASNECIRVVNAWGMDTALYYLLRMNHKQVVADFLRWDEDIFRQCYGEFSEAQEDGPEPNGDLRRIIASSFPTDLTYLLHPNTDCYSFFDSPGRPWTLPRLHLGYAGREDEFSPYAASVSSMPDEGVAYSNREAYARMLDMNPNLGDLAERLDLMPASE